MSEFTESELLDLEIIEGKLNELGSHYQYDPSWIHHKRLIESELRDRKDSVIGYYKLALENLAAERDARQQAEQERDAMRSAIERQVANIERWMATGEPASAEESHSIYEQMVKALEGKDADYAES